MLIPTGWDANSYLGSPDGSFDRTDDWYTTQKRSRHGSPTSENYLTSELYNAKIIDITDSKRVRFRWGFGTENRRQCYRDLFRPSERKAFPSHLRHSETISLA